MDLIVDGYNLLGADQGLHGALEHKRNRLVQQLSQYQTRKQFNVTVVFDGWRAGSVKEASEKQAGVAVIYSRLGEKADQVVIRIAREKGSGAVVVSSDREIRSAVERFGAVAIYAAEFNQILRRLDGDYFDDDEGDDDQTQSVKHGNPNRLSKADRRRVDKLRKLRL
jgi:predicted RNA-binding protein with PIN domain